jgi:hypothetical protein
MCGYRPTRAQWARTNNTNTNLTHEKSAPWKTVVAGKPASNRRAIGHKAGCRTIHPSRDVIADNPIPVFFGARLAKSQPSYTQDESPVGNT